MLIKKFEDLIVWEKSHRLTLDIYLKTKCFPKEELFGLVSQIRRSSMSICANIAEGQRKSTKDFSRFLQISLGSLEETKYYLILSRDLQYISLSEFTELFQRAEDIGRMLTGLRNKLIF
ncbi:MAG: four helix bundle protein [Candidatus Omnitrophica bacterium]|nr:four helix bundle protein [Candidatus Omnitrophota bacterium]